MSNKRNNELLEKVNEILTTSTNLTEDQKKSVDSLIKAYERATYKNHSDRHEFYRDMVSTMTNDMCFEDDKLADKMANEHPTLQQSFMRFVCQFIRKMAKREYTDGRNERAVALAKRLVKVLDEDDFLPFI